MARIKEITEVIKSKFWDRVEALGENECWEWKGAGTTGGYGYLQHIGKVESAHRMSWILNKGKIPKGMHVCHTCDNPPCVNPNHLFIGTAGDNVRDMVAKGRGVDNSGEKNGQSKLTEKEVLEIRKLHETERCLEKLGNMFGVSHQAIRRIVRRESWRYL